MAELKKLPSGIASHYLLAIIVEAGQINTSKGIVDLSKIDSKKAKELAEDKDFIYLVKKTKPAPAANQE